MATNEPVHKEIHIDAPPEHVFTYLTESEKMIQWMGVEAELEAKPGGMFRVDINGGMVAQGEYVEVVPYSRIVFTWGWEGDDEGFGPGATTVKITLREENGGTLLRLEHHDLPEDSRDMHVYNWEYFLGRIAVIASGGTL